MHIAVSHKGCVADPRRVEYSGGKLWVGAEDWQAEGVVTPRAVTVPPFSLDAVEVTLERWDHCVRAGTCRELGNPEPGAPVTQVDPKDAERFCRFEKGRLPSSNEWLFAAAGAEGRRFPWGATGLVCRRAAFGLVKGPCAYGGGPDLAGAHPEGATPEGVLDMAGNVAEWALELNGQYVARGGSFKSDTALELKSWSTEPAPPRAADIGFRCAYDVAEPGALSR
jgi:formylglycine-generating enzyme required for sulfatase activity